MLYHMPFASSDARIERAFLVCFRTSVDVETIVLLEVAMVAASRSSSSACEDWAWRSKGD